MKHVYAKRKYLVGKTQGSRNISIEWVTKACPAFKRSEATSQTQISERRTYQMLSQAPRELSNNCIQVTCWMWTLIRLTSSFVQVVWRVSMSTIWTWSYVYNNNVIQVHKRSLQNKQVFFTEIQRASGVHHSNVGLCETSTQVTKARCKVKQ